VSRLSPVNLIKKILLLVIIWSAFGGRLSAQTYTPRYILSGRVTDFSGNPIDSAVVELKKADFTTAASALTGTDGKYQLITAEGKYMALTCIKASEYPSGSNLNPEDQRLRFWAWNIPVTGNLEIDIRYHRLEIYGLTVFRIQGSVPGYTIYCRPVSLTRVQQTDDPREVTPEPENLDILVEINGRPVKVNSVQRVQEYAARDGFLNAYLLQVAPPTMTGKLYDLIRVMIKDKQNGDTGEAIYFKERDGYW